MKKNITFDVHININQIHELIDKSDIDDTNNDIKDFQI